MVLLRAELRSKDCFFGCYFIDFSRLSLFRSPPAISSGAGSFENQFFRKFVQRGFLFLFVEQVVVYNFIEPTLMNSIDKL